MNLIQKTKDLEEFCEKLKKEPYITVDLEFLREKTYFAQICLIQVGSDIECAIIDPLAKGIDLSSFFDLMKDKKIVKVFHSCRQDIEILYNISGFCPYPVFDTQIAAEVAGFGESVSYETLVNCFCKQELNKSCRFTNWQKRPLDEAQLDYAIGDVTYLRDIYKILQQNPHIDLIKDKLKSLSNEDDYKPKPEEAWKKIRHRSHNSGYLTILRELAKWREIRAIEKDVPRKNVVSDDMLLSIASAIPTTIDELLEIRNIRKDLAQGKMGQEIINCVKEALNIKSKDYVKLEKNKKTKKGSSSLIELLKLLLKIKSQELDVTAKLLATEDELLDFANGHDKGISFLNGWKKEVFGNLAIGIRNGDVKIAYNSSNKRVEFH
ncbi:MAG: ribonuclease D [Alphaproteobacteria bacterium]